MTTLTEKQREYLEDLTKNTRLYIGYNCPVIMRQFDILVRKGYAEVVSHSEYGKEYQLAPEETPNTPDDIIPEWARSLPEQLEDW